MRIEHEETRRLFVAYDEQNRRMGEIEYEERDADLYATHTRVEEAFEGHGVGSELLDALAAFAGTENRKIVPVCSFVVAMFKRNPEKYAKVAKPAWP